MPQTLDKLLLLYTLLEKLSSAGRLEDQYAVSQPEEFPTMPVQTKVKQLGKPESYDAFENFGFGVLRGKGLADLEKLLAIRTLAPVYAHKNLAFIGPAGTGKTHLAQAFGYECCRNGLKTCFIKASELLDKFTTAQRISCLQFSISVRHLFKGYRFPQSEHKPG